MTKASTLLDMMGAPAKASKLADSVIIIVDAQREYLDGSLPLAGIDFALVEIKKLLAKGRAKKIPIIHIAHETVPGAPVFDPNGAMSAIIDAVKPEGSEPIIKKNLPSAFVNTNLDALLKELGKQELIIAGFMTHMCVSATARSAMDLGYTSTVVADACATRDLPSLDGTTLTANVVHKSNLASLADLIACVCKSSDDIV